MAEVLKTHVALKRPLRQWRAMNFAALIGLSGCASVHLFTPEPTAPDLTTGSLSAGGTLSYGGSDRGDWDLIRSTVTASLASSRDARVEWRNTTTGNTGTISDLASVDKASGQSCRSFASTIAAVDGVRLFHAELCQSPANTWEYARIEPADAALPPK